MKKLALFLLLVPSFAFAEGPLFTHKEPEKQQEFENVYKDIRSKQISANSSGSICIDLPTFCVDSANNRVGIGTPLPTSLLHLSSGTLTIDGTSPGMAIAGSTFTVSNGRIGIGTASPSKTVHIANGEILNNTTYTISSSADTNGPSGTGFIVVVRDGDNGGTGVILYENNTTPVIISQAGTTVYVTGAPAATQVQVKNASGKISFLGGSSRNGTHLNVACLMADFD